jgi:hypothetical protein
VQVVATMVDASVLKAEVVKLSLRDQVEFERHFHTSIAVLSEFESLSKDGPVDPAHMPPIEHMAFLAYRSLVRGKVTALDFETFLDDVSDLGFEADATPAEVPSEDPTQAVPPAA